MIKKLGFFIMVAVLFWGCAFSRAGEKADQGFYAKGMARFRNTEIIYNPEVDKWIEEDYFKTGIFHNVDFSEGAAYWGCFPDNIDCGAVLDEYRSVPASLKVVAEAVPVSIYYIKNPRFARFQWRPWAYCYGDSAWFGIKPKHKITVSLYYKGARPTVYINLLKQCGNGRVLVCDNTEGHSEGWERIQVSGIIPEDGRAVSLELTLNNTRHGKIFYIDDVSWEVVPCGER